MKNKIMKVIIPFVLLSVLVFMTIPASAMDSDGSFTFDVGYSLTSSNFTITSNSISISLYSVVVLDPYGEVDSSYDGSHRYSIELYQGSTSKGIRTGYVGNDNTFTFKNLDTSKKFHFVIRNTDYLPAGWRVNGSGSISNFGSVQ